MAFSYIYPEADARLLIELPLDGKDPYQGLLERVNHFSMTVTEEDGSNGLVEADDKSPNWNCFSKNPADFG